MTYYGRWTYKYEEASRKGALGVLIIHRDRSRQLSVARRARLAGHREVLPAGRSDRDAPGRKLDPARCRAEAADRGRTGTVDAMIDAAGKPGFHAIELPVRFKAHIASKVRHYESDNVIAEVPGAQPGTGRPLLGALRPPRHRPRREGRQHLQRRCRQRHRLRHPA